MELNKLEDEFFEKLQASHQNSDRWKENIPKGIFMILSKAAATLCEKKMREAIDLARETWPMGELGVRKGHYTKEEIIKLLTEQKDK